MGPTTQRERKRMTRLLLTEVTVTRNGKTITCNVRLQGGQDHTLTPASLCEQLRRCIGRHRALSRAGIGVTPSTEPGAVHLVPRHERRQPEGHPEVEFRGGDLLNLPGRDCASRRASPPDRLPPHPRGWGSVGPSARG